MSKRFQKPYFHIPTRLRRKLDRKELKKLEEKQQQLHKANSWEDMCRRGDDVGHGVRKLRHGAYRILAVVEPKWQCMWAYSIYHKDEELRIDEKQIQETYRDWEIEEELKQEWQRQQKALQESSRKPTLPEEDREWLTFPNQFFTKNPYLILESPDWYEGVSQKSRDWLKDLLHPRLEALLKNLKAHQKPNRGIYPEDAQGGPQIHYQWFSVQLPHHSGLTWVLYLHGISSPEDSGTFETVSPNWEEAAKRARRAYPDTVLEDRELWITTVKDLPVREGIAATLALSEEELRILINPSPRPLFVNGRAGSGKTTLLYWLFAEYLVQAWYWKKRHKKPFRVRFLTYSERLRNAARHQVRTILRIHPWIEIILDGPFAGRTEEEVWESILTFREFLLQELNHLSVLDAQNFVLENYIDFPRFREEYLHSPIHRSIKRRFSPEQAWFAIRALILGYDADFEMDPDWYAEVFGRKDEKVFSEEDFQTLYERVYLQWYRNRQEDQGWWNEVDLARAFVRWLRDHPEQLPEDFGFHLLVVDEAQDFTRVEFQLLFRLLYWTRFAMSEEDWKQVPLILAGDPLQTINPTGFRWAYVKDMFNNALAELDLPPLSLEVKSLKKNYRSTQSLVCLSNAVLAWRQRLFRERGKKGEELYQEAWYARKKPVSPKLYPFDRAVFEQRIPDKNFVVIGPWFSGQDDNETYKTWQELKPRELLSPEEAKGLEYERVILTGFGQAWQEVQNKDELKKRLFWARLYVALTRARKDIAIVEEPQHIAFWQEHFIRQVEFQESEGFPAECIAPFLEVKKAEEFGLEEESWLSLARNMYERAQRERNAKWFAQAAKYFENALNSGEVSSDEKPFVQEGLAISRFYAALLTGDLEGALDVLLDGPFDNFTKHRHFDLLQKLTLEVWRRERWDLLQHVAELYPETKARLRDFLQRISTFMEDPSLDKAFQVLDRLQYWQPIPLSYEYDDHRSEEVLRQVFLQWLRFLNLKQNLSAMSERQKRHLAQRLSLPTLQGILEEILGREGLKEIARLLFGIGRDMQTRVWLRRACELWEQTQSMGSREYAYARALLSGQPIEALVWWVKAGEYERALHIYQSLPSLPSCREDFWRPSENRKALKQLWRQYKSTWRQIKNLDDLFSWLNCLWEVDRREALYLWKEARDVYEDERKRWHGWLKSRIEHGIPYEAWRDIEEVLSTSEQKDFRDSFLQSVARYPQRLERFLDAIRKRETSLEGSEWPLLLEAWGRALQKAEEEDRLVEWADLRNRFDLQEQIREQFQHHLLKWMDILHQRKSATHLWRLYEWLLGGEQPEQALWHLFTDMYRQARKPSQRAFFVEQIYTRRRTWKNISAAETCTFVEQLLSDLDQRRFEPHERLLKQIAVLIEQRCPTPETRSRHLQRLALHAQGETLQHILKERAQQWLQAGLQLQPWEDIDQVRKQDFFPEALQDDLVLMLHGRNTPFQRIREWYQQASPQARQSMLEMLLQEARNMRSLPPQVGAWLREIARDSDLPQPLVVALRKQLRLKKNHRSK